MILNLNSFGALYNLYTFLIFESFQCHIILLTLQGKINHKIILIPKAQSASALMIRFILHFVKFIECKI